MGVHGKIVRPLWLNQGFFTEDVTKERFHELCLYYLVDISDTTLLSQGRCFTRTEDDRQYLYQWLPLSGLKDEYLYPLFIKENIHDLPQTLTILAECE